MYIYIKKRIRPDYPACQVQLKDVGRPTKRVKLGLEGSSARGYGCECGWCKCKWCEGDGESSPLLMFLKGFEAESPLGDGSCKFIGSF